MIDIQYTPYICQCHVWLLVQDYQLNTESITLNRLFSVRSKNKLQDLNLSKHHKNKGSTLDSNCAT